MANSPVLRHHSDVLLAYSRELRQAATAACERGIACREMGRKARILADVRRVKAEAARKRQDDR